MEKMMAQMSAKPTIQVQTEHGWILLQVWFSPSWKWPYKHKAFAEEGGACGNGNMDQLRTQRERGVANLDESKEEPAGPHDIQK